MGSSYITDFITCSYNVFINEAVKIFNRLVPSYIRFKIILIETSSLRSVADSTEILAGTLKGSNAINKNFISFCNMV